MTLPFGDLLSSTDSATAVAALFARVDSTTKSSDFPSACMSAVPSVRFSDRPRTPQRSGNRWDLPVLASGVSTHAQGLRLRRVRLGLAILGSDDVAFPKTGQGRHAEGVISEFNGWPACTPCPCNTHEVTLISVGFGAERLARPFSYDSFIRYFRPVYPGAFPVPFPSFLRLGVSVPHGRTENPTRVYLPEYTRRESRWSKKAAQRPATPQQHHVAVFRTNRARLS